jgi:hypothetical protein
MTEGEDFLEHARRYASHSCAAQLSASDEGGDPGFDAADFERTLSFMSTQPMNGRATAQIIKREYMKLEDVEIQQSQCFVTSIFEIDLVSADAATAFNADLRAKIHAIRARGEKGLDDGGAGWQTPLGVPGGAPEIRR